MTHGSATQKESNKIGKERIEESRGDSPQSLQSLVHLAEGIASIAKTRSLPFARRNHT